MNPHDFFTAAYQQLGGKPDVSAKALLSGANHLYFLWRDCLLEEWATAIYEKHGTKLLPLQDRLLAMVGRVDTGYFINMMSSDIWGDDEDVAFGLAWATAVLRWHHTVRAGRVSEDLPATLEDAERWLEQYAPIAPVAKTGQMSLFLGG